MVYHTWAGCWFICTKFRRFACCDSRIHRYDDGEHECYFHRSPACQVSPHWWFHSFANYAPAVTPETNIATVSANSTGKTSATTAILPTCTTTMSKRAPSAPPKYNMAIEARTFELVHDASMAFDIAAESLLGDCDGGCLYTDSALPI